MKRLIDFVIAALCLVIFSPLILVCWLTIKIGGGPAIYKQERIGLGGKPFYIYKFRSMVVDAEKEGEELLQQENDPRLTRASRCHQLCNTEERIYRHHRQDAHPFEHGPLLSETPVAMDGRQNSVDDIRENRIR